MLQRVDVAVIGGGPAGAIVALLAARLNLRVLLIERGERFRRKTCGHCLGPRAMPLLERIGPLERVRGVTCGETHRLRVHGWNGGSFTAALSESGDAAGLLVERGVFDQMLRDSAAAAGAEVLQPASARVTRIDRHGAELHIRTATSCDVRCRLLVGADGTGSAAARAAGLADAESAGRKYGFALDIADVASARGDADGIESNTIEMFLAPGGYLGVVRQNDRRLHLAALVGTQRDGGARDPMAFVRQLAELHPPLAELNLPIAPPKDFASFTAAGPMPWRPRGVATESVALVGDAAGYAEPFTGEGMTWAIESAMLLSDAITDALSARGVAWDRPAADMYAARWSRQVSARQRVCRWLGAALQRPMVSRWMIRAGAAAPMLTRRVVREVVMP